MVVDSNKNETTSQIDIPMKKALGILALALVTVSVAFSADKPKYKEGSCCDKAAKAGKECAHPCCVEAAKKGEVCKKCNG